MTADRDDAGATHSALDTMSIAFEAIRRAREYGFDTPSAAMAALEDLNELDQRSLAMVAATLAAFIATDLRPTVGISLELWTEIAGWALAYRDPDR